MKNIYLDNAATTPMLPEVVNVVTNAMNDNYGNPSSVHQIGRKAKSSIETARKKIASYFNVSAGEIFFTSGGTEADNMVLQSAVLNLGVDNIVTTKIEHHAVLYTVEFLKEKYGINVVFLGVDVQGQVNVSDLEGVLGELKGKTLVSLMWVNNEIGNILPIKKVAEICKKYKALFHSDTVQAVGHYELNLQEIPVDFMVASAHKFHGPKGVGFVFVRKGIVMRSLFHGGGQERGMRSSTENVYGILGMQKALEISIKEMKKDRNKIEVLKKSLIEGVGNIFPSVQFNGVSGVLEKSSYTILNIRFPFKDKMLLFNFDLMGLSVSGGSACQSGSSKGSHVLQSFLNEEEQKKASIRFSFSKLNTIEDIKEVLGLMKKLKNQKKL
ncbi:Cysteine desulfurase IscS [Tenacibaculum sp. 190524A02b]|uniref:cysteine desulfurase family protein n=1 Tax=Tenacibaculum vairaonense TaxID=3137860 RepID=UPI0032B2CE89